MTYDVYLPESFSNVRRAAKSFPVEEENKDDWNIAAQQLSGDLNNTLTYIRYKNQVTFI